MLFHTLYTIIGFLVLWIWKKKEKSSMEPPDVSGRLPLVGHAHKVAGDRKHAFKFIQSISEESLKRGEVLTFYFGPYKSYVVTDPDDCLFLSNKCLEKNYYYYFAKPLLGNGLTIAEVPLWKTHRKHLNPLFRQRNLNDFLVVFNYQSKCLVENFRKELGKGYFDHGEYISETNLNSICKTAFGAFDDFGGLRQYQKGVHKIMNIIMDRIQNIWLHSDFLFKFTYFKKEEDNALKRIVEFTHGAVTSHKLNIAENTQDLDKPDQYKTFISMILDMSRKTVVYTDEDLLSEINTIVTAGYDTVSCTVNFALMLLGSHPDVQKKVYDEIHSIFHDSKRDVDKDDLPKLYYLEAVIKETLRLYPVGPVVSRLLVKDIRLRNYKLKAGNSISIFIWALHRHPAWGPDVNIFKPERWLDPSTLPENPNLFAGFSLGRRDCIGKTYAMMSMKTMLVHVLRSYVIKSDISKLELEIDVLLRPASGQHIIVEERLNVVQELNTDN